HVVGKLGAIELLILILLGLERPLELRERNLLAVYLGGEARAHAGEVDAPEDERDREQAQDDACNPATDRIMNLLQHVASRSLQTSRPPKKRTDPKAQSVLDLISGGVDGTRTRDPRRDRPVF